MRRAIVALAALVTGATLAVADTASAVAAMPPTGAGPVPGPAEVAPAPDELPNPLEDKRRQLRESALTQVINGEATPTEVDGSTVVQVGRQAGAGGRWARRRGGGGHAATPAKDQYVELAREATDRVFVLLVEFGDQRHPDFPDQDTDPGVPGPARFDGPLHNQIPAPDRAVDNSTIWQPDFSPRSFQDLYFGEGEAVESMKTYYETQSSGRYSIDGRVMDWVKVPYNEARYGRSNGTPCEDTVCDNTWALVRDGMDAWVAAQRAAGVADDDIAATLASYDVWDRYDFDGDGDFNERDGYIDHLQVVHAGGDQADGDPWQGEDAIWSHRWYAYVSDIGVTGPDGNPQGGTEVADSGVWAGDYTVQAENGGLSTIAHEYGHDLGLPDHYDTAGGQNGVEWWTLMAQSRVSGEGEPVGTRAADLSAWDKLQLGWLSYEVVEPGQDRTLELGPHEYNTRRPQALITSLPKKRITFDYGRPHSGQRFWWSSKGDDLATSMARQVDLGGAATAALELQARFEIEAGYDYLYVQASTNGGATWENLDGTVGGRPFARDGSDQPAISGSSNGAWLPVAVPLDPAAGAPLTLRLLYRTDGGVALDGFFADDVTVRADGQPLVTSGAEAGDEGWTLDGFRSTTGTETGDFDNYYVASHRSHVSYDRYLATGPYNFGFPDKPDWVEHFGYEQGLLVSYWDTSQLDNNTSQHPGEGLVLPVDAHPDPLYDVTGAPWRSRVQVYDAPFSRTAPRSFTLHVGGRPSEIRGGPARPVFDDGERYWDPAIPQVGVKLPKAGVRIEVTGVEGTTMSVHVTTR
ncbi:MAG TPA: immune inhibitor A domain-containing protein [Acidimicrobiales bacterium]|nr:immune inhibitor A domain-containing protein [Acidimicrobiales bacterium]